jgi:hypothetical protein
MGDNSYILHEKVRMFVCFLLQLAFQDRVIEKQALQRQAFGVSHQRICFYRNGFASLYNWRQTLKIYG